MHRQPLIAGDDMMMLWIPLTASSHFVLLLDAAPIDIRYTL